MSSKKPIVLKNTNSLCHCCSDESYFDIIYTTYNAKITLCYRCAAAVVSQIPTRGGTSYEQKKQE
jgi:hypothetical protein